jgi:predicted MFS family arabinose efflux permease
VRPFAPHVLRSLRVRNYRLYFAGQVVSTSGNWMQQIAIAWLVLQLTNSAFALGMSTALQSAPYLAIGPWGGLIADRYDKRRLLIVTQCLQIAPPMLLWLLTASGGIRVWMVYALVAGRGLVNTVDNPARQSFVAEMVGDDHLVNAVSLNASVTQAGRLIGPAVATAVIAIAGLATCFLLNALTFLAMAVVLLAIRPDQLRPADRAAKGAGQLRAAFSVVRRETAIRVPLTSMAVIGLLSFNFTVVLPALARFTFHGTAATYALLANALGLGALAGALVTGMRTTITPRFVALSAVVFGIALTAATAADDLGLALPAMAAVGAASVTFSSAVQACLQLAAAPEMRGRILGLYQLVYQGTTPFGALLIAALAASVGARFGFAVGAAAALATGIYGLWVTRADVRCT